jgi:hypothetical protein
MFVLRLNHPHTSSVTHHPSREVALVCLHCFLESTGHRLHVATATWTHARYEILDQCDHVVGHAAVDEICACTHIARDHEETGCTAISFDAGPVAECRCPGHRPVSGEPSLFPTPACP